MANGNLFFVSNTDPTSKKQARQHVASVIQQRENQNRKKHLTIFEVTVPGVRSRRAHPAPHTRQPGSRSNNFNTCLHRESITKARKDDEDEPTGHSSGAHKLATGVLKAPTPKPGTVAKFNTLTQPAPASLELHFSASRSDPFRALPVTLNPESTKCLDHYNTSLPFMEFNVYEGAPLIPSRHLAFRSALNYAASLHAIVAVGAIHLVGLYGLDTSKIAEYHIAQAIRTLRTDLSQPTPLTSWTYLAQACFELAAAEDFRGNIANSRIHLSGLKELIASRGGITCLDADPRIQCLSCYIFTACRAAYFPRMHLDSLTLDRIRSCLDPCSSTLNQAFTANIVMQHHLSASQQHMLLDLADHVRDFHDFMNNLHSTSELRAFFATYVPPNSPLMLTLTLATLDSERFGGLGAKGYHRVFCLFTIVGTVSRLSSPSNENQNDWSELGNYLKWLAEMSWEFHSNLRLLQFLLMQHGTATRFPDPLAGWQIVRLMQVYKLLPEEVREVVNERLTGYLTGGNDETDGLVEDESTLMQYSLESLADTMDTAS